MTTAPLARAVVLSAILACVSCSGDDRSNLLATSAPATPTDEPTPSAPPSDPVYVVHSTIENPEGRQGYFIPTPTIETGTIDTTLGIEEAGGGRLYNEPEIGTFLIGGGEQPTITRYELDSDGGLVRGETVSFANHGVAEMYDSAVTFVSASKAYYADGTQAQLIAFDPSRMEITGQVNVPEVERDGFEAYFGSAIRRADAIYFPVAWYEPNNYDRIPDGSALVRVVPDTDEYTVVTDARCPGVGLSGTVVTPAGDAYLLSGYWNTVVWRGFKQGQGIRDCALRLRADDTEFDASWFLDVTTRTGGLAALPVVSGGGTSVWIKVLDESVVTVPSADIQYATLITLEGWVWHLLDLESDAPARRNDARPPSVGGGIAFVVDDRTFTIERNADLSETTLLELTPSGFFPRIKVPGTVRGLARLR